MGSTQRSEVSHHGNDSHTSVIENHFLESSGHMPNVHHESTQRVTAQTKSIDLGSNDPDVRAIADDHSDIHTPGFRSRNYTLDRLYIVLFFVTVGSFIALALFSFYYYAFRMPDGVYRDAASQAGSMIENVDKISYDSAKWPLIQSSTGVSVASVYIDSTATQQIDKDAIYKVNDAEKNIQEFGKTLNSLAKNQAIQKDSTLSKSYLAAEKQLKNYDAVYASLIASQKTVTNLLHVCTAIEFSDITSLEDYKKATECLNLIRQNPTVTQKEMSTKVYEPTIALLQKMLTDYQGVVKALQSNNSASYNKYNDLLKKNAEVLKEMQATFENFHIATPSSPKSTLQSLKASIENRQKVLLR